jgi:hypothetical protein
VLVGGLWFFDHDVEPVEVGAEEVREIYSKPQLYDGEIAPCVRIVVASIF